jgi:uncharacterized protein YcnI
MPATAAAHVTVTPGEAPAGSFTVLDIRVPHESTAIAAMRALGRR